MRWMWIRLSLWIHILNLGDRPQNSNPEVPFELLRLFIYNHRSSRCYLSPIFVFIFISHYSSISIFTLVPSLLLCYFCMLLQYHPSPPTVVSSLSLPFGSLVNPCCSHQTPTCCLLATTHPSPVIPTRPNTPHFTALVLTLIRLEAQTTDIVVTVNVPHYPGRYDPSEIDLEEGQPGKLIKEGMAIRDMVLQSLEVADWGLFQGKGGS